jgi:hypothetical protein
MLSSVFTETLAVAGGKPNSFFIFVTGEGYAKVYLFLVF